MLNMREEIRKGLQELRGLERGKVAVGVNESSIHALLPSLDRFRNMHPGIHLRVHRVFSRAIPRELLNHQLDIGVISYLPEERELATVEFYRDSLVLVVWPEHRLAKRREVDISALGEETFVAHIVESPYRQRVVQMFAEHKVPLRMDVEMPTIESIKRFVEMKKGVAIVPRMCVVDELARIDNSADESGATVVSCIPEGPATDCCGEGACGRDSDAEEGAPPGHANGTCVAGSVVCSVFERSGPQRGSFSRIGFDWRNSWAR
jgi:DNA-binding transcriptional LysR family regulator